MHEHELKTEVMSQDSEVRSHQVGKIGSSQLTIANCGLFKPVYSFASCTQFNWQFWRMTPLFGSVSSDFCFQN